MQIPIRFVGWLLVSSPLFAAPLAAQDADSAAGLTPRESVMILEARERLFDRHYEYDHTTTSLGALPVEGGPPLSALPDSLGPTVAWQLSQRVTPCRKNDGAQPRRCPYHDVILMAIVRSPGEETGRLVLVPRTVIAGSSGTLQSVPPTSAVVEDASWAAKKAHGITVTVP